jgi:hypothetical protein
MVEYCILLELCVEMLVLRVRQRMNLRSTGMNC